MSIRYERLKVLTPFKRVGDIRQVRDPDRGIMFDVDVTVAESKLSTLIKGDDVLVAIEFNAEMARHADQLKLIHSPGAGYERIALEAVPTGVVVCNNFEHENAVAEWVLMAMIALDRQVLRADRTLRAGSWAMSGRHGATYPGLQDRTVGVIGLGRIGRRIVELAKAFRMHIIAATRTPLTAEERQRLSIDLALPMSQLDTLLSESDFIVPCVPVTEATRGLIGPRALALMKPTTNLINIARGEIIDEGALYQALVDRRIAGAAMDVWWNEPVSRESAPAPSKYPYCELDNVLMSPHASAMTESTIDARIRFLSDQLSRLAQGQTLQNVVHTG
jgi:phosphoglycerate dehydrogenase-like enzyme